jgi:tetratricopeptide (TPR) repeat protein
MTNGNPTLTNPYVGPRRFEQEESKFFFGRDEEIKILSGLVVAHQLSLFYAQSGAGKSSLLRAGLLPRLTRKIQVGSNDDAYLDQSMAVLPIVTVGRGVPPSTSEPIRNIFSFSAQLTLLPSADPNDLAVLTLVDALDILLNDGIPAGAIWEPAQERNGRRRPPLLKPDVTLLIIDQFEEIFTVYPERWHEREAFFRQVADALSKFRTLHILFAMREDYLAELTPYAHLLPDGLRHRFRMERLRKAGALLAVTQPALAAEPSRTFAPGVAEELVNNLRRMQRSQRSQRLPQAQPASAAAPAAPMATEGEYVEPVHLQIVCRDLWAGLPADRTEIQARDLQDLGDVDQALTNFYENTLARVVAETAISERTLRRWFTEELITPARTKALVYRDDERQETAGLPNAAVDLLQNAWLIRSDMRGGDVWYELAHDRLVEPILAANLHWASNYDNPVAAAYARWVANKSPDLLLRDQALAAAETYARQQPREVTDDETQYLKDSRREWDNEQAAARNQAARRRTLLATGGVVMLLLAGLTLYAFWQADQATRAANIAFTRQLLAQASQAYGANPLLGLRLALEADAHLTQPEPLLRSQILSQTLDYLAQGKIATLATNATRFMDVPDTPWFITKVNAQKGGDELRRKADGALMSALAGSVSSIELVSETSPFFVVRYESDVKSELRRKADGALVPALAGSVSGVELESEEFPFFVVHYDGDVKNELRRKADGALVSALAGAVSGVGLVSEASSCFIVVYEDGVKSELRRKADGVLLAKLTGAGSWIHPINNEEYPLFVVLYEDGVKSELRRTADCALVSALAGSVSFVYPVSETSPFFLMSYEDGVKSELRRRADGVLLAKLTGTVSWAHPIGEEFSFFMVRYNGEVKSELRRKADGALVAGLTGSVRLFYSELPWRQWSVELVSETSPFFIVSYDGGVKSELRRRADGVLLAKLTGVVRSVELVSEEFPFFVVHYDGDMKSELRRKADGALVPALAGSVSSIELVNEEFPFFVVHYESDVKSELRRKADGALVPALAGSVSGVELVSKEFPFFVVHYDGDVKNELRRKADGALVLTLAGSVSWVELESEEFPFFVVHYDGDVKNELRRKADGALVSALAGSVTGVELVSEASPFFVVIYPSDTPGELRRKADGVLISPLADSVYWVNTFRDTSPYFAVGYWGDTPIELRNKADGALVPGLAGTVLRVDPISDAFPYVVVDYKGNTPSELRNKVDAARVITLTGSVREIDTISAAFPYFVVDYFEVDTQRELRRKADGALVLGMAGSVDRVDLISDISPYFVVYYADYMPAELRNKVGGALVSGLAGAVAWVDPISAAVPYFVVRYRGDMPSELRHKADAERVIMLAGAVDEVDTISDTFPYFVVTYEDDTPRELRRKADGMFITEWVATIDANEYATLGYFFVERSDNRHTELWQLDPPKRLTDLGIGLPWKDGVLPAELLLFNVEEQTLAIRYEDGRAYLFDLAWLAETQERTTGEGAGNSAMPALTCLPFATHPFTETLLQKDEYLGERPTLTCPEPLRLVEQGRHAARQLDVDKAKAFFQAAIDQDPTLALEPETTAAQLAAQSLVRQGNLLLWQSKLDEAATKLAEARGYDPTIAIDTVLQRLIAAQLSAGQASLTEQQIVSATLRFDALVALEETFGVGTLDQTTKVAVAQAYITIGETLAQAGNAAEATAAFAKAQALDPALTLDPVAEVTRLAPTPTATAPPSPLATPTPVAVSPLVTATTTVAVE